MSHETEEQVVEEVEYRMVNERPPGMKLRVIINEFSRLSCIPTERLRLQALALVDEMEDTTNNTEA